MVGAFKTLALKKFSDEHWASNCLSGLNNECLREVVKDHAQITLIVKSWNGSLMCCGPKCIEFGDFQTLRIMSKKKLSRNVVDVKSFNVAQRKNEETQSESIANANARRAALSKTAWKASCFGRGDSDEEHDDFVGDHE